MSKPNAHVTNERWRQYEKILPGTSSPEGPQDVVGDSGTRIVEPRLNCMNKTPSEETTTMMTGDTSLPNSHLKKKLRDRGVYCTLGIVGSNTEASW